MRKAAERPRRHVGVPAELGTSWFRANVGPVQKVEVDAAFECFDYIMNTRSTYKELGEAVGFFERAMKRDRKTIKQEMCNPHGNGGPHPWSMIGLRRWYRMTSDIIGKARKDYEKNFKAELDSGGPTWITNVNLKIVLLVAVRHRDRWST